MAKLTWRNFGRSGSAGFLRMIRKPGIRKMIVVLALVCVLMAATTGLAQSRRGAGAASEAGPPRQMQKAYPWPWLAAFVILALAMVPAFKSSKREMGG